MRLWAVLASRRALSSQTQPADVVPQPLVVKYELANRLRELVTLPLALESRCDRALALGRSWECSSLAAGPEVDPWEARTEILEITQS